MGAWRFSHHWGEREKWLKKSRGQGCGLPYGDVWVIMDHSSQKYLEKKFTISPSYNCLKRFGVLQTMSSSKWTFNATSSQKLIATQKNELN